MNKLPTKERVESVLCFNPETGVFTWKSGYANRATGVAGYVSEKGYVIIGLFGKLYRASRLAWLLHYGEDPYPLSIDHINRVRTDNSIQNLRKADVTIQTENRQRVGPPSKEVEIRYPDGRGVIIVDSAKTAARILNVSKRRVYDAICRHGGGLYWGHQKRQPSGISLAWATA